jgi:hypothetical protein
MFLRILFGGVTYVLVRFAVAAGLVVLCYIFFLKPVLNTTHDALKASGLEQIGKTLGNLGEDVQHEVHRALRYTRHHGGDTRRLVTCIKHAHNDAHRIHRCTRGYGR